MIKHSWARHALAASALALAAASGCSKDTSHDAARRAATSTTRAPILEHNATTTTAPPLAAGQHDRLHPSAQLTPGASFPDVTAAQVCTAGYSATVRDVDASVRRRVFDAYGISDSQSYTLDHLVPLELGGSNDVSNLWPQPAEGSDDSHSKDGLENALHDLVCDGSMTLASAQKAIVSWDTVDVTALRAATTSTTAPPPPRTEPPTTAPPVTAPPLTEPPATLPPAPAPQATEPAVPGGGATALCNDGTYSYAAHHQGACSRHGGVAVFYN